VKQKEIASVIKRKNSNELPRNKKAPKYQGFSYKLIIQVKF